MPEYGIKESFVKKDETGKDPNSYSLNQVLPERYKRVCQGFRITKDGNVIFPSRVPFKTREEAEKKIAELIGG
jgi:hypothetical protein